MPSKSLEKDIEMHRFSKVLKNVKKTICILLLFLMGWQQWTTFLSYQEKFLNPIKYTRENYGKDGISMGESRFNETRKMFVRPVHLTYFGEANEDLGMGAGYFALTQYYLAPNLIYSPRYYLNPNLVLRSDISQDTLLYNLYATLNINLETNFHLNNGWHVMKDFNNGLILLAK